VQTSACSIARLFVRLDFGQDDRMDEKTAHKAENDIPWTGFLKVADERRSRETIKACLGRAKNTIAPVFSELLFFDIYGDRRYNGSRHLLIYPHLSRVRRSRQSDGRSQMTEDRRLGSVTRWQLSVIPEKVPSSLGGKINAISKI